MLFYDNDTRLNLKNPPILLDLVEEKIGLAFDFQSREYFKRENINIYNSDPTFNIIHTNHQNQQDFLAKKGYKNISTRTISINYQENDDPFLAFGSRQSYFFNHSFLYPKIEYPIMDFKLANLIEKETDLLNSIQSLLERESSLISGVYLNAVSIPNLTIVRKTFVEKLYSLTQKFSIPLILDQRSVSVLRTGFLFYHKNFINHYDQVLLNFEHIFYGVVNSPLISEDVSGYKIEALEKLFECITCGIHNFQADLILFFREVLKSSKASFSNFRFLGSYISIDGTNPFPQVDCLQFKNSTTYCFPVYLNDSDFEKLKTFF